MTPQERFVGEVNRMFAMLHPAPIPAEDRVICSDCGRAIHDADANWYGEHVALCDRCDRDREHDDSYGGRA
jgi:hypothetical protein